MEDRYVQSLKEAAPDLEKKEVQQEVAEQ